MSTIHPIGTAAVVVQITGTNWPRPAYTLLVTGICRFKIETMLQENPFPIATVTQLDKLPGDDSGKKVNTVNSWLQCPPCHKGHSLFLYMDYQNFQEVS